VLLLENIHPSAVECFKSEKYQVESLPRGIDEAELCERIKDVSILGIRSGTKVTEKVLDSAPRLLAVGAFCIGTNQIDLDAAASHGIAVFNAPFSNTRSVVELAIGGMVMLSRQVAKFNDDMHAGKWNKSASGSHELRGRTLGIVGYGNIGSQLSVLAESLGMKVVFHDVNEKLALGNAHRTTSLQDLLKQSDFVSLHVDGRKSNKNLFGDEQFAEMKQSALFLNLSRGHVVEEGALVKALESGKIGGAFLDVYQTEPSSRGAPFKNPLQKFVNVILTPHVAGVTEESQENIGNFVSGKLIQFINTGNTDLSVNLPQLSLPEQTNAHRLIHIHRNTPGILAKVNALLAENNANLEGQYLGTKDEIGYVITDINASYKKEVVAHLRELPETIRMRILY
jgi:D-3-phosphoglycerate dehydrogenase